MTTKQVIEKLKKLSAAAEVIIPRTDFTEPFSEVRRITVKRGMVVLWPKKPAL